MRFTALLLLIAAPLAAANHIVDQKTFDAIAGELSGERAQELDRAIVEYHRIQGSPMMADVASRVVVPALRQTGIEAQIDQYPSDGKTLYQTYISPMGWDMRGGELWLEGETPVRLCRYSDVPMCVSTYSKGGQWNGELIDDLILFEAVGFMNGRRSNREIADLLSIEFVEHIRGELVNQIAQILGSLKLVQPEQSR